MTGDPFRQRDALPPGVGARPGPVASALGALAGVFLFVVAVIAGGFLLLLFLAAAVAMAAVIGVRVWWWRRRMERQLRSDAGRSDPGEAPPRRAGAETIDGEYTVLDKRSDSGSK